MDKKAESLLIIFYRNPSIGKVKTRLAATVGDKKALEIYRKLALHTREVTHLLNVDKIVFYSDSIDLLDQWPNAAYLKAIQEGSDLGEKMENAFDRSFNGGYKTVCIIGTDCFELTPRIVADAFAGLEEKDAVVGPARDGGYYLLGLRKKFPAVFRNKAWSTGTVCADTLRDLSAAGLCVHVLPELADIDTENDLPAGWRNGTGTGNS